MRKEYILGEVFPVKFLVHSEKGEPFRVLGSCCGTKRQKVRGTARSLRMMPGTHILT